MPKDYLDPKQNPFIPQGIDPDNPDVPMSDEERAAVDMNPEGLAPCDLSPNRSKIKEYLSDKDFFAVYGPNDEFLYSVKLDDEKIVLETGEGKREPTADELERIGRAIDKRED